MPLLFTASLKAGHVLVPKFSQDRQLSFASFLRKSSIFCSVLFSGIFFRSVFDLCFFDH